MTYTFDNMKTHTIVALPGTKVIKGRKELMQLANERTQRLKRIKEMDREDKKNESIDIS